MSIVKWNEDEKKFMYEFIGKGKIGRELNSAEASRLVSAYRKRFNLSSRSAGSICAQYYQYTTLLRKNKPPVVAEPEAKKVVNAVNMSPPKATVIENLMVDLIDAINELVAENKILNDFRDAIRAYANLGR